MTNKTSVLRQFMLILVFSFLTFCANAQNTYEAEQRARAANEAASKKEFDRNKAISTGRGAPNPLQGVLDEQERQQIARKAKEREKYQAEEAEKARQLAKFKEEYAKSAGQRAIEAQAYGKQRDQEDAFTIAFRNAGLQESEAYGMAHGKSYTQSMDKLIEIGWKMDYLKKNIASADFNTLDTELRQLTTEAPLTALKYIYQLDRFTTKEAEIDALKLNALLENGFAVKAYFGDETYNNDIPIFEGNKLKLLELYFALEDKYPDVNSIMDKAFKYQWIYSPYYAINEYYNWHEYERNFGKAPSGKIKRQGAKLRLQYFERCKQKNVVIDENKNAINVEEAYLSLEGVKKLSKIYNVSPGQVILNEISGNSADGLEPHMMQRVIELRSEGDETIKTYESKYGYLKLNPIYIKK